MSRRLSPVVISLVGLVVLLAGLNVYQFLERPKELNDEEIVDRFHAQFYAHKPAWLSTQWLGVRTLQNPNDVWSIQEVISEVKPDFIVETGTAQGGSAALWATILEQVNPDGQVISIDIRPDVEKAKQLPVVQRRVEFLTGSSTSAEIVEQVRSRVRGGTVVVILDSDHRAEHVLEELRLYSPMVPVGSYVIVQDSNVGGHPVSPEQAPGPMEAIEEFLAESDAFRSDRTRERFLFSFHPKGYLRRIQ